ncbi:MAG: M23 family metallopeptidase [Thermotogae bacterium]|nr:M23 family metallopeptidase [Thermotogota bacterium]
MHEDYHTGVDLPVKEGTPVFATARGVVVEVGENRRYGKYVRIRHARGYESLYAHLQDVLVKRGDSVQIGRMIGLAGSTGMSTGPHVHYEVYKDGKPIDPVLLAE